ncbi:hypothetical protein WA026_021497 [Henosepilachna vigintioctopunctata]|uniref:Sugar phosphate phosphatase n=1 Tax=Henosepilachna vigintioctopunctata TaxID=420089 RepID=A0AAW1UMP5_9CUCU
MSICPCNCKYHRSIDIQTPLMVPLSAFFKSFAFHSVRERFPVVIKRIMEDLMKRRDELATIFGEPVREELKKVVDELAELKYALQSNKEMSPIVSVEQDAEIFNYYLQRRKVEDGRTSPYNTQILFAEAYLYRRLRAIFEKMKILNNYDYFGKIKEDSFEDALPVLRELAIHMEEGCECISDKDAIFDLMKVCSLRIH